VSVRDIEFEIEILCSVIVYCVIWYRLIPQALPTLFSGASELLEDSDLSSDISQSHVNSDMTLDDSYSVDHCIENIGNGIDL